MSILGDNLRALRGPQSQREMAEPLGIKWNAWARYERGEVSPSADMLARICTVHAVSADKLLGLGLQKCESMQNEQHTSVAAGDLKICSKCPFKEKLLTIEKVIAKQT